MDDPIYSFYRATKLLNMPQMEEDASSPITHVKVFHKSYPRFPHISLIKNNSDLPLAGVFSRRRSSRDFHGPLTLAQLSSVLLSCRIVDGNAEPERRAYPSAGARFPIELYPLVFDVQGLSVGAYHCNLVDESLELLLETDLRPIESEIVSPYVHGSAIALIMTSVLSRSAVKYGIKAYPYSLLEAGHIAQNVVLMCASLGIGACPIGGFVNDTISTILDLVDDEIPLYVVALGNVRSQPGK